MKTANYMRELFEKSGRRRVYPKGTIIVHQGGSLDFAYYITDGLLKISETDSRGERRTFALFGRGHVFPVSWLLTKQPKSGAIYDYETLSRVTCIMMNGEELRRKLKSNPQIAENLIDLAVKSYINAGARITNLQKTTVSERVEFVLYYVAILLGNNNDNGLVYLDTPLTHQELADLAGLSRETVSRELSKPRYDQIFWKKDGQAIIDVSNLNVNDARKVYKITL